MLQYDIWHIDVRHLLPKLFTVKDSPSFWSTLCIKTRFPGYISATDRIVLLQLVSVGIERKKNFDK